MEAPQRLMPGDPRLGRVLALIRDSFADMDGRIDPPSSMHRLTPETLERHCETGEVWALGTPPAACVVLTPWPGCLYLVKLAVDRALELQVRVELTGNQAAFARMGFVRTGETAHAGYDRPTSITMRRAIG